MEGWEEWKEEGNKAYAKKEYREAVRCYSEALRVDPENATLLSNR